MCLVSLTTRGEVEMQITEAKIKEFIERCYAEKDCNRRILMQQITFKLQCVMSSPAEAEILPHVFKYLQYNQ